MGAAVARGGISIGTGVIINAGLGGASAAVTSNGNPRHIAVGVAVGGIGGFGGNAVPGLVPTAADEVAGAVYALSCGLAGNAASGTVDVFEGF